MKPNSIQSGFAVASLLLFVVSQTSAQKFGDAVLVHEWNQLEFAWPSNAEKEAAIQNQTYVPERSMLAGIKIHKDNVYVTIPRWRWLNGHPVVLAKVVNTTGKAVLEPYPSWAAQKQGDCNALQYVQSMEIDPNTDLMYVIDTGVIGHQLSLCPAKVVIYDLKTNSQIHKYEFPQEVVNRSSVFLNDIVLDYINGTVRYLYITNTFEQTIVVYDLQTQSSYKKAHPTMGLEGNGAENITINGVTYTFPMAINGIAMSPDFKYVYYSSLAGYNLHQVPTSTLRSKTAGTAGIRVVGRKTSQTDGLAHGNKRIYYGAIGLNAVYFWDKEKDLVDQKIGEDRVMMTTQKELKRDNRTMEWPDTFAFDEQGWIWVITSRLQIYWVSSGLPVTGDPFIRVWKIYVNETSYLNRANERTVDGNNGAKTLSPHLVGGVHIIVIISCLSIFSTAWSRIC
ncbi:unnamed protein product [Candidula unifasciata]|uniref:Major royal jelly protein n=1 Tax=Candidula unifasciata TaxID=100452 RepID=A0A8S3ZDM7_9EUPU|nr:unnamed protein product [Candidula unifasciata]